MNTRPTIPTPVMSPDRHAAALADVRAMHDELTSARATITDLNNDIHRLQDRVTLLVDERDRFRAESVVFRTKLIELATSMTNIGLLTVKAQEIVHTVEELNRADTEGAAAIASTAITFTLPETLHD